MTLEMIPEMTNDSILLNYMQEYGCTNLATSDKDFDEVKGITVLKPADI